ncbi:MAG: hypothetical protein J0I42_12150 [Bosea sp.]|uniref:hypothetical protein n=1 Tax=Bosea sp. (in: a-proteobacteria) TaxID=1871050 RepID=UPI001AD1A62B|nr:hypothetical protein [Bosea sp. (in: a-proteobacteria)]MBN9452691.1 hypothetical protein [Bosea sp. (in: a-proteobacteria)]
MVPGKIRSTVSRRRIWGRCRFRRLDDGQAEVEPVDLGKVDAASFGSGNQKGRMTRTARAQEDRQRLFRGKPFFPRRPAPDALAEGVSAYLRSAVIRD